MPASDTNDRRCFLGGSDASAVIGLSPWATPLELWQQKTGRSEKRDDDPAAQRRYSRGHKLEPFIRDMVIDKLRDMGLQVELIASNARYADEQYPFFSCEIDFELLLTGEVLIGDEIVMFDGEHVNADAKSVSGFARKKWGDENTEDVPIEYAAQFMFGLGITGRRYCLVAALRSFDDVDLYWTLRDDETIAAMREKCADFWVNHVQADIPPDPFKFSDIVALFPLDNGHGIDATDEVAQAVAQLRSVNDQIKQLEEQQEALKFLVCNFISPHAELRMSGRPIATWKAQQRTSIDKSKLGKAEIFRRNDSGEFEAIADPVSEFSSSSVIRVLRLSSTKARRG